MGNFFNIFNKKNSEKEFYQNLKKQFTRDGKLLYSGELLKLANEKYPNKIALECEDKKVTYREFYFRAIQFSEKLKKSGIKSRDKVIIYSGNSLEFYIAYFAIWQIGAIIVPLNIFLHDKEFLYVVENSEATAIFVSDEFKNKIDKFKDTQKFKRVLSIFSDSDIDWGSKIKKSLQFEIKSLREDELALLLYTSGTTGKPKGVMLSSKNIMTNILQVNARLHSLDYENNESYFSVLPLFHVFAQHTCLWSPVLTGSRAIIVKKIDRKLILKGLQKKPTIFVGFPALYGLLAMMKTAPLDSIKLFISGADAMPDKIRMGFGLIYGRKICAGYGLTEASPVVGVNHENENLATQFIGYPLQDLECEIRDDQGSKLPAGQIGTLWLKGDNVMMGYYKSPEVTAKVLQNGWLNTGDLGFFNKQGYLAISGRSKDLIIHKGFNIYPQEVENILLSHPEVYQAAVIGKADSSTGQIPIAYVASKGKLDGLDRDLRRLCFSNLASYKIPKKIICLDKLPMNATGKIDKKELNKF